MAVYLDNSATTKPYDEVRSEMTHALKTAWGNPSSLHEKGLEADELLEKARARVAKLFRASTQEVLFAPSGTLANNAALFGAARRQKRFGNRIVTTTVEHPSVSKVMDALQGEGFEIVRVPISNGELDLTVLENALTEQTVLVSVMAVNNEIGTIFPIPDIAKIVRRKSPHARIHCDAVQAFGKVEMQSITQSCDLVTVSAHKLHGPKGVGALYRKKGVTLAPLFYGGAQEDNVFSGTQAMPAIMGFGKTAECTPNVECTLKSVGELNEYVREELLKIDGVKIHSPKNALPYILSMSVSGLMSETMLNFLSEKGIYISNGSACSHGKKSAILQSYAVANEDIQSTLRVSLAHTTTKEELTMFVEGIKECKRVLYGIPK